MAEALIGAGKKEEALVMQSTVVRLLKAKLEPSAPMIAESIGILGSMYGRCDRVQEGIALVEETVRILKKNLPADHTKTIESMNKLATLHSRAGQYKQAEKVLRQGTHGAVWSSPVTLSPPCLALALILNACRPVVLFLCA